MTTGLKSSNYRLNDVSITPTYRKPFSFIAEGLSRSQWLPGQHSHRTFDPAPKVLTVLSKSQIPLWIPGLHTKNGLLWRFTALITEKNERNHTRIISYSTGTAPILRPPKPPKPQPTYRNPIAVAKEYAHRISSGEAKNESDLAKKLGVSGVRVHQYVSLLNLEASVIQAIETLGDPMPKRLITERRLRLLLKAPKEQQEFLDQLQKLSE